METKRKKLKSVRPTPVWIKDQTKQLLKELNMEQVRRKDVLNAMRQSDDQAIK